MSDAGTGLTAASNAPVDKDKYVLLNDGTMPTDESGKQLAIKKPTSVSLVENAKLGQDINAFVNSPAGASVNADIARYTMFIELFGRGKSMDYQRTFSADGIHPNPDYVDFGNYNYGVVAAAAGFPFEDAMRAAGIVNALGSTGDKSGPWWNNKTNLTPIQQGYNDYKAGKIIPLPR